MANERDLRVAVVQGCFTEGGDSILSAFTWEPLLQHWIQGGSGVYNLIHT